MTDTEPDALTSDEATRLQQLEVVIDQGVRGFTNVGQALLEVRDSRLYRASYDTFHEYCRKRWGFGRSYAHEIMQAAEAARAVSGLPDTPMPRNARVAAELAPLRDDPDELRDTWKATVKEHGPAPTAAQVRDIRNARNAPADASPAPLTSVPEPAGAPERDIRFEILEDVVDLIKMLPEPEQCVFPNPGGDFDEVDVAMRFLADWTPRMNRAWKQHKAAVRSRAA